MIKLGDKVKDPITKFEGVAVARTTYQYGCVRISVQGPMNKDGTVPDWHYFDEPQLEGAKPQEVEADHGPKSEAKLNPDIKR